MPGSETSCVERFPTFSSFELRPLCLFFPGRGEYTQHPAPSTQHLASSSAVSQAPNIPISQYPCLPASLVRASSSEARVAPSILGDLHRGETGLAHHVPRLQAALGIRARTDRTRVRQCETLPASRPPHAVSTGASSSQTYAIDPSSGSWRRCEHLRYRASDSRSIGAREPRGTQVDLILPVLIITLKSIYSIFALVTLIPSYVPHRRQYARHAHIGIVSRRGGQLGETGEDQYKSSIILTAQRSLRQEACTTS